MALICRDNVAEPFVYVRRHTQPDRSWDTGASPLPDAHPSRDAEAAFQSGKQPHDIGANQEWSTTHRVAYYELAAFRGWINHGQP